VFDNADQEGKTPHCAGEMISGNETDCLNSPKTIQQALWAQ